MKSLGLVQLRYRLKWKLHSWLQRWPWMSKNRHLLEMQTQRSQHAHELEQANKRVISIIDRASRIEWRRDEGGYSLLLTLNEQMFGGAYCSPEDLEHLAKAVAYRVEGEVATLRFVRSARELEREKYRTMRPPWA